MQVWVARVTALAQKRHGLLTVMMRPSPQGRDVLVRFAVQAPDARTVSLAGDFNGWETEDIRREDSDGDGIWQVVVPLNPGLYQYMFVVNGVTWIPDPTSPGRIDDGFGRTNSLLRITHSTARTTKEQHHVS